MTHVKASIVLPTYNRRDDLAQTIESALKQSVPVQVIVMDDGSTDGTEQMMRERFPQVQYNRLRKNAGPNFQRTEGVRRAAAPIVFPVDDDSVFHSPTIVETTLRAFDHPRVGGVAIPFVNVRLDMEKVFQLAPDETALHLASVSVGCSHAMRRDVFLGVGGYRANQFMANEENDLAMRMLDAGYVIRLGWGDPIHHLKSPIRNTPHILLNHARNHVLFAWHNVPMPYMPIHMLATTVNMLRMGVSKRCMRTVIPGLSQGYRRLWGERSMRLPVSRQTYRLYRRMRRRQPPNGQPAWKLEDIEPMLGPLREMHVEPAPDAATVGDSSAAV